MLAGYGEFPALLLDLAEQARVLNGQDGMGCRAWSSRTVDRRKAPGSRRRTMSAPTNGAGAQQGDDEKRAIAGPENDVADRSTRLVLNPPPEGFATAARRADIGSPSAEMLLADRIDQLLLMPCVARSLNFCRRLLKT